MSDKYRDDSVQRDKTIRRVILLEGSANLVVLLVKLVVGFSTGSLAILGEAVHSLTDFANNIVAWIVVRLSGMPADREHPYGHRKFETLAVFGLAALLTVLAFELALHAIRREETQIASGAWGLGLMLGVLGVNIILAYWQRRWAHRLDSDILLADANHTFADVLMTIVVIVGWQLSAMGYPWLDTVCALGVTGLVLYLAYGLFKRVIPVLVDQIAVEPEPLIKAIQAIPGVRGVRQVRSRWVGSSRAVDMIVVVDQELSTAASHEIADAIELLLQNSFHVRDVSIHIEPSRPE